MYLDVSEQAQKIFALENLKVSETLGVTYCHVFLSPKSYLTTDVERFLCLNGKFCLNFKEPLDDRTLVEQWGLMETKAMWAYVFRQQSRKKDYDPRLLVPSDAIIPELPYGIEEGLEAGMLELLRQAAHARTLMSDRANPGVPPVRAYLQKHSLLVKATDTNLALAVFTKDEYVPALMNLIKEGPYESVLQEKPSLRDATALSDHLLARLPVKGLTSAEVKYLHTYRKVEWPQFHIIPKVHKHPWGWLPIVPAHSSSTVRMSKVADITLAQYLPKYPHLIQSTAEWIRALEAGYMKRTGTMLWLVTGDIVAYYTNVDIDNIARSMESILLGNRVPAKRAAAITWLVRTVTHNNYFQIDKNGNLYRQTNGLAMGSPCSGTVANLELARREPRIIARPGILAYTRYIDDIFCLIEANNVSEVRLVLQEVSETAKPLSIEWNVSNRHAVYLDGQVSCSRFELDMAYRPYRKPGN